MHTKQKLIETLVQKNESNTERPLSSARALLGRFELKVTGTKARKRASKVEFLVAANWRLKVGIRHGFKPLEPGETSESRLYTCSCHASKVRLESLKPLYGIQLGRRISPIAIHCNELLTFTEDCHLKTSKRGSFHSTELIIDMERPFGTWKLSPISVHIDAQHLLGPSTILQQES